MDNPIKMDDLGGKPTIFGNTHIIYVCSLGFTYDFSSESFGPIQGSPLARLPTWLQGRLPEVSPGGNATNYPRALENQPDNVREKCQETKTINSNDVRIASIRLGRSDIFVKFFI